MLFPECKKMLDSEFSKMPGGFAYSKSFLNFRDF